jgi:DNA processing protein
MEDSDLVLLAMMSEHCDRRAELARAVAGGSDPLALAAGPSWRVGAEARRLACRQAVALAALGIRFVRARDLPEAIARVQPPVPGLFVRGDPALLRAPAIAIVGTRQASPGPLAWAASRAALAARAGWLVISGGARGIDGAAHRAALDAGHKTLVYLGVAVDRIYPDIHRQLFERVLACGGALVSEDPPLARTYRWSHARRNRFIAAQADHVLIAEAGERSGSLGTADFARRLGVPVWVPPAEVGGERAGIAKLLAEGTARVLVGEGPSTTHAPGLA